MTRLRVHPEARREASAATMWYRTRSHDAARDFARAVRAGVQSIRERPAAWARWKGSDVRRKILRRFPYSIFYIVENDAVMMWRSRTTSGVPVTGSRVSAGPAVERDGTD